MREPQRSHACSTGRIVSSKLCFAAYPRRIDDVVHEDLQVPAGMQQRRAAARVGQLDEAAVPRHNQTLQQGGTQHGPRLVPPVIVHHDRAHAVGLQAELVE